MNRLCLFVIVGVMAGCTHTNTDTMSTQVAAGETIVVDNPGQVTVAGVTPAAALGAIDTQQVAANPTVPDGGESTAGEPAADADGAISVEGAQAAAVLGAIDTKKLIDEKPQ